MIIMLCSLIHSLDKGDTADVEPGTQEEDLLIQDEIYKSRLSSIKRVSFLYPDANWLLSTLFFLGDFKINK